MAPKSECTDYFSLQSGLQPPGTHFRKSTRRFEKTLTRLLRAPAGARQGDNVGRSFGNISRQGYIPKKLPTFADATTRLEDVV